MSYPFNQPTSIGIVAVTVRPGAMLTLAGEPCPSRLGWRWGYQLWVRVVLVVVAVALTSDSSPPSVVGLLSRVSGCGAVVQAVLASKTSQDDGDQHRDREHPEP